MDNKRSYSLKYWKNFDSISTTTVTMVISFSRKKYFCITIITLFYPKFKYLNVIMTGTHRS